MSKRQYIPPHIRMKIRKSQHLKQHPNMLWDNDLLEHFYPDHTPTLYYNIKGVLNVIDEKDYDYNPNSKASKKFHELKHPKKTYSSIACQTDVKTRNKITQTDNTVVLSQREYQTLVQRANPQSWFPPFMPLFRPILPYGYK
jgi:hypothetical protein